MLRVIGALGLAAAGAWWLFKGSDDYKHPCPVSLGDLHWWGITNQRPVILLAQNGPPPSLDILIQSDNPSLVGAKELSGLVIVTESDGMFWVYNDAGQPVKALELDLSYCRFVQGK